MQEAKVLSILFPYSLPWPYIENLLSTSECSWGYGQHTKMGIISVFTLARSSKYITLTRPLSHELCKKVLSVISPVSPSTTPQFIYFPPFICSSSLTQPSGCKVCNNNNNNNINININNNGAHISIFWFVYHISFQAF